VLPSTLETVTLCADIARKDSTPVRVRGESEIPKVNGRILRVTLDPAGPSAYPGAIQAILQAELIVIGPGSLYTSLLPNLLVPEIVAALKAAPAPKVFVCNVATQPGETDHYTAEAHVNALEQHLGKDVIDIVLVNSQVPRGKSFGDGVEWVKPDIAAHGSQQVVFADLMDEMQAGHHNSHKLAGELVAMLR
ncbi:MAG: YvcK family protein, partial [Anaerolineae bacterium]|nr:YvcK family protein [Anaerolineae bacterium]